MEHVPELSFSQGAGGIGGRGQLFSTTVSPDFCVAPTRDSHQHVLLGSPAFRTHSLLVFCALLKGKEKPASLCSRGHRSDVTVDPFIHSLTHSFAFSTHGKPNAILGSGGQNHPPSWSSPFTRGKQAVPQIISRFLAFAQ